MKCRVYLPIEKLREQLGLSERALAGVARISRRCLRQICAGEHNATIRSIGMLAEGLGREVEIMAVPRTTSGEHSTVAVAYKVERDGFDSWKIHFMDFVDELRRTLDPRLVALAPHRGFEPRLTALLAALVRHLGEELDMTVPPWAARRYYLETPWFVSGMESLKASALVESPPAFRNNNIFVLENFTERL